MYQLPMAPATNEELGLPPDPKEVHTPALRPYQLERQARRNAKWKAAYGPRPSKRRGRVNRPRHNW